MGELVSSMVFLPHTVGSGHGRTRASVAFTRWDTDSAQLCCVPKAGFAAPYSRARLVVLRLEASGYARQRRAHLRVVQNFHQVRGDAGCLVLVRIGTVSSPHGSFLVLAARDLTEV